MHHKDGDHYNNDFNNLELLCPTCHALESNNSGAGTLFNKTQQNKSKKVLVKYYCTECGLLLSEKTKTGMCNSCYRASTRTVDRPDKYQLATEIIELGFMAVGRKYGVTDNAIRK